jgi:HB1, ASXL, restriction endonuclease HTH domain
MAELTALLRKELQQIDRRIQELGQRKQAIENLLRAYRTGHGPAINTKLLHMPPITVAEPLSTLDMAQRVLEKRGEMKAEDIMEAIRQDFGIKPAHTLPQMLYIRARAKKRFYRTSDGRFGLIESKRRKHGEKSVA